MKAEPWILTRRQDDAQRLRHLLEKRLEPPQRIPRVELVQVVDHEHSRLLE